VAVPTLGIGGAWLCRALAGHRGDRSATALGSALVLGGATFAVLGGVALQNTPSNLYSVWVGAETGGVQPPPNFDIVVRDFGHALYPWSALALLAPARLLQRFVGAESATSTQDRAQALWLGALATCCSALFAQTALSSQLGLLPFVALAPVAVLIALGLEDLEAQAGPVRSFVLAVLALTTLLLLDFRNFPEKGLVAFAVPDAVFPESFAPWGFVRLLVPSVLALVAFFFVLEPVAPHGSAGLLRSDYAAWPRTLLTIAHGHVFFALLVAFFGLVVFDLLLIASDRVLHIQALQDSGSMLRLLVRVGWTSLLALVSLPWGFALGRDLAFALLDAGGVVQRWAARRFRAGLGVGRAASAAFCLACASASFATAYYPALLLAMSSERAFSSYSARARAGEPLGLLGLKPELARYSAGSNVSQLPNTDAALSWLFAGKERRFLATDRTNLPGLNAARRQRSKPPANLIVLEASSEVLLVSNELRSGELDRNPLADIVLTRAVAPAHPLDANLGNKLDVLGWQVNDANGAPATYVTPARNYEFVIFYRVVERLSGRWETFVHFDGFQRRYNADHPTLQGRYPFSAWLPGDVLADRHTIRLEPNFTPGRYRVFLGLYSGSRRLEVRRGAHEQDRIVAGSIEVR